MTVRIGILTVSDRASQGVYEDRGGPRVGEWLREVIAEEFESESLIVPDETDPIGAAIRDLSERCCLVLTTGGTGPSPRDVTPEATEEVCSKILPGFGETMRAVSRDRVPTSILSRQLAGVCGSTLVINLPGSPGGISECLEAVFPAVPHCVKILGGPEITTERRFRPGHEDSA